jgi:nitroreductase
MQTDLINQVPTNSNAIAGVGLISQNVYLFCASENLATVVVGSINRQNLAKLMNLKSQQRIILTQPVGYPK